jgi:hypothetical protein
VCTAPNPGRFTRWKDLEGAYATWVKQAAGPVLRDLMAALDAPPPAPPCPDASPAPPARQVVKRPGPKASGDLRAGTPHQPRAAASACHRGHDPVGVTQQTLPGPADGPPRHERSAELEPPSRPRSARCRPAPSYLSGCAIAGTVLAGRDGAARSRTVEGWNHSVQGKRARSTQRNRERSQRSCSSHSTWARC